MAQASVKEKILFLINPNSGTKHKGELPKLIHKLIDSNHFEVEIIETQFKGEATELVNMRLLDHYRYFIAVGGDGTVNEVAQALINKDAILGIIPTGSGNGLARHLKIPMQPAKAILLINKLNYSAIDYGTINAVPFFCTCGIGFDALIGEKFDKSIGRGLFNYIKSALVEYFRYKPEIYKITIDNRTKIERKAFLITFANSSQYGNNAFIAPKADICDGKLDMSLIAPFRFYQAPSIGFRLFTGTIDQSPLLLSQQAKHVYIEREAEGLIHFDGETGQMGKELEIMTFEKGINIIIPTTN
jgi:diacylglycerol kinase (ATP)